MRVMVTGCAGFIGSHLSESLLENGHDVIGVDCFNDNYGRAQKLRNLEAARGWESFEFIPVDLSRGELHELVEESEVVFHLAAEPGVRLSWGTRFESYLRNNVLATQHLLEAAKTWPGRFVYASSSSIYGDAERLPTPEATTPAPYSPYGTTKLAAEHLCRLYHGNFGVDTVQLRYFSVYGPRQRPDMAFSRFCRAALQNEPLTLFGDGQQTRDFTYVADVVAATRLAASSTSVSGDTYNVGGGSRVSLAAAIARIEELAGRPLTVDRSDSQQGDVRDTGADTEQVRAALGFAPATDLNEGLRAQFEWTRAVEVEPSQLSR